MYLHEEYIKRNNLNVKIVVHARRSLVLLRNADDWWVFSSFWRDPEGHPGSYKFVLSEVVRNGINSNWELLKPVYESNELNKITSDIYEERLFDTIAFVKNKGFKAIELEQQELASWQILLKMCENYLNVCMDASFFELVESTKNEMIPLKERYEIVEKARKRLPLEAREIWTLQLSPWKRYSSEWLIRLIND